MNILYLVTGLITLGLFGEAFDFHKNDQFALLEKLEL